MDCLPLTRECTCPANGAGTYLAQDVKDKTAINISAVGLLVRGGGHSILVLHPVGRVAHDRLEGEGAGVGAQQPPHKQPSTTNVQGLESGCNGPQCVLHLQAHQCRGHPSFTIGLSMNSPVTSQDANLTLIESL